MVSDGWAKRKRGKWREHHCRPVGGRSQMRPIRQIDLVHIDHQQAWENDRCFMIRMSTTASADFLCSKCKKGYAWYADFAGKVARCTCGAVIQFPHTDPKPRDPLAIAFLPRTIEEASRGTAPMELPKEDTDPKILAERRALAEFFDEEAPIPVDPVRDVHLPF